MKSKLSGQMVKSLGKSIIHMYSMGACAMLGIKNQDELSNDLDNDPFLNSALQNLSAICIIDTDSGLPVKCQNDNLQALHPGETG